MEWMSLLYFLYIKQNFRYNQKRMVEKHYKLEGEAIDNTSSDPRVQGIRRFYEIIAAEPRVSATALQTVGSKGYDGFVMAVVKE